MVSSEYETTLELIFKNVKITYSNSRQLICQLNELDSGLQSELNLIYFYNLLFSLVL